jgi:hypothetical protein
MRIMGIITGCFSQRQCSASAMAMRDVVEGTEGEGNVSRDRALT